MNCNNDFGVGHNQILRDYPDKGRKYHIVLNPNVSCNRGILEILDDYLEENKDIGNVMPKIVYPNGVFQYLCKLLPAPKD